MKSLEQSYLAHARNELTESIVYRKLALMEKREENRTLLETMSTQERNHYEFWQSLIPGVAIKPYSAPQTITPLMRIVLGVTFTTKFLETHEENSIATYEAILPNLPETHRAQLQSIIKDEQFHENALLTELKEKRVEYIGFVALGLADAIVEITGVHAGFLGVTGSTLIAGVAGVIVGFSAAISMASAAYLQAKQDPEKSALLSGFITGVSYLASVVVLALPYFLIRTMATAFTISTSAGILLLGAFTFYGAIIFDRKFWHEFRESISLMLGTAIATFLLGTAVGKIFNVSGKNF